jgi:hypothetical protein
MEGQSKVRGVAELGQCQESYLEGTTVYLLALQPSLRSTEKLK